MQYLSMYLRKHPTPKSVQVNYELSLINPKSKKDAFKSSKRIFGATDVNNRDFEEFIKHQEIVDLGFVKRDTLLVKAYVEVL